jgi:hypothetical protein
MAYYAYTICDSSITCTDIIKDLRAQIDSKLHFHAHLDYIVFQSVRILGLVRTVTYSFSTLDNSLMLYLELVRCELAYAAILWNSMTSTDARMLEPVHRNFVVLCHKRFYTHGQVTDEDFLKFTNLRTLHDRGLYLDTLLVFVY